ncbi:unnamed protein product, partial [Durusdinium trenchii]
ALGPQRTVSELIPYVVQVVQEEPLCNDDEFLYSMARQYAVLSDYINGNDEMLIAPLEHLAAQEETVIRDQAIQSLCKVIEKRPALAPDYLVPALHRLATKTDFFTARVSACALLPLAYRHVKEDQKAGLRKAFTMLCADETPMVRRAAAHKMRDFVSVCAKQATGTTEQVKDLLTDLIGVYKQLSQEDTQDTIRVACVHATLVIAKMLNADENRQHTVTVIKEAAEDRSWRVRLTVAKNFDQLCQAFGPELTAQKLMQPFIQLMKDNEQEVRKEAVRVIEACLNLPGSPASEPQRHMPRIDVQCFLCSVFALTLSLRALPQIHRVTATQRQALPVLGTVVGGKAALAVGVGLGSSFLSGFALLWALVRKRPKSTPPQGPPLLRPGKKPKMLAPAATKTLKVVLLGKTGHGKSTVGNKLLGQSAFKTSYSFSSETKGIQSDSSRHLCPQDYMPYNLQVYDTQGFMDTNMKLMVNMTSNST